MASKDLNKLWNKNVRTKLFILHPGTFWTCFLELREGNALGTIQGANINLLYTVLFGQIEERSSQLVCSLSSCEKKA